jgi:hypothetical protein
MASTIAEASTASSNSSSACENGQAKSEPSCDEHAPRVDPGESIDNEQIPPGMVLDQARILREMLWEIKHQGRASNTALRSGKFTALALAMAFGLVTIGAWKTSDAYTKQGNCLARSANIFNMLALCTTPFAVSCR